MTFQQVLDYTAEHRLFQIPDSLMAFTRTKPLPDATALVAADISESTGADTSIEVEDVNEEIEAIKEFLQTPFDQISQYFKYVNGQTNFDTHQGVKGLEFPRVMVIISDEEARGFQFSYDKLFGVKTKTKTDLDNEASGLETSIDRTRRLFYVICSRATQSLAIVAYSNDTASLQRQVISRNWFEPQEVEVISD